MQHSSEGISKACSTQIFKKARNWATAWTMTAVAILCLLAVPNASAAQEFAEPKGVVELFTSQGCRSCPPADRAFQQLVRQGDVVALSYHVDYWNYLAGPIR